MQVGKRSASADPLFRGIVGVTACLAVTHVVWILRGTYRQTLPASFFPTASAVMLTGTLTATVLALVIGTFLAFGRYRALHDRTSWWLGIGFATFSVAMVFRILSFPFMPGGAPLVGRSPSSAAWIVMSASTVFAGCLLTGLWDRRPGAFIPPAGFLPVAVPLLSAAGIFTAFIVFGEQLPTLVMANGALTVWQIGWHLLIVALLGSGAVTASRRYLQTREKLPAYVAFAEIAMAFAHLWSASGGNRYSVISAAAGLVIPTGYLTMVFGLLSDYVSLITRERQQSRDLRTLTAELIAILEGIPDAVVVTDLKGGVRFTSQRALDLLGLPRGEQVRSAAEIEFETAQLPLSRVARGEIVDAEEIQFRRAGLEQRPVWLLVSGGPLRDESAELVGGLLVATDITSQKRAEEELVRLNARLDQQVLELQATEAALRRSNEDLQQFAYVASHDLREPLRNVSTHAELLARSYAEGTLAEYGSYCVNVVTSAAKRMEGLITGLLMYARATSESGTEFKPLDLNVVLQQSLTNLQRLINETGASVRRDPLPTVCANPIQMEQVFQNLIGNSLKYKRPDVRIEVSVTVQQRDEDWLFCVRDNGQGFKPEYTERIFGIFRRLHGPEIAGSGIGLPICRAIIARHNGTIWAEGDAGHGAAFYFTLPRTVVVEHEQTLHLSH